MGTNFHLNISDEELIKLSNKKLKPFSPFFLAVSGAHIYGFASPDSDIDIRGSFLLDKETILGFRSNKNQTVTIPDKVINNVEVDFVCHEFRKYTKMIAKGENGYVLEQIFSPVILFQNEEFDNYKDNVKKFFITKKLYKHYSSFAYNKLRNFEDETEKKVKTLLYAFRVLHTGIHLFKTGEIITNLKELNELGNKSGYINELIEQKQKELSIIESDEKEINFYRSEIEKLLAELENAHKESDLPENVRNSYKLNRIVSGVYSNSILDYQFILPPMRSAEDRDFINKASEKLLLKNSPLCCLEKDLNTKLSPEKIVYLPNFENYFLLKKDLPRGKFYEFIDIEKFLQLLRKSNPFCLLALYNPHQDVINENLIELINKKELIVSKQIYKTFKSVAVSMFEKMNTEEEFSYKPKRIILMLSILIHGSYILKTGTFEADLTPYLSMFKAIKNKELPIDKILEVYNDLSVQYEESFKNTVIKNLKPDDEIFNDVIRKVKTNIWLTKP